MTTEITLKTSVVTSHSLNLAETHSPVGSYPDKSDNPHLNGDYHKILACSHGQSLLIVKKGERTAVLVCSTPLYEAIKNKKQASLLGKRCLLLLSFFLPNIDCHCKSKDVFSFCQENSKEKWHSLVTLLILVVFWGRFTLKLFLSCVAGVKIEDFYVSLRLQLPHRQILRPRIQISLFFRLRERLSVSVKSDNINHGEHSHIKMLPS